MIITFTLYQYVIYMALFATLGAILGITFCWYRINYKPIRGAHRERRTSSPTYRDAYTKGWEDGMYKRLHAVYGDITDNPTAVFDLIPEHSEEMSKPQEKDEPVELEVRGELKPGSSATPSFSDW